MEKQKSKLSRFYGELRRRNVLNTIVLYIVTCWIILQVGSVAFPIFEIHNDYYYWLLGIFIVFFPVVVSISWFYNLTINGFERIAPFSERRMLNNIAPVIDQRVSLDKNHNAPMRIDGWYAKAVSGPVEGLEYRIDNGVTIGRAIECEITLLRSYISRMHARFVLVEEILYIEDLNSSNGTLVNNKRISERVRLHQGDEIQFKDIIFKIDEYATQKQSSLLLSKTTLIRNK
ncbi:FHA domain-containing protein [Paraglaciecola arctica]|uniref:FHA domain-containing protein n=1 Tax=Paraglaciecola arctica TaxID=1128911 RepID=UPI001C06ED52|nr:FHA domain-containing protein [Paraglaciecola arctica]MBU3002079.1 FHA domain-containing protein [Paraglaciecola arctica]